MDKAKKVDKAEKLLRIRLYIGIAIMAVAVIVFSLVLLGTSETLDPNVSAMYEARNAASDYKLADLEVTHGGDYVIQWEDAAMEAHIRFLLDKPEGDILHSDVWDIAILSLQPGSGTPFDSAVKEVPEGYSVRQAITSSWKRYGGQYFPEIQTLCDLRHFDSLQILLVSYYNQDYSSALELTGLDGCQNLRVIELTEVPVASLAPLAGVRTLEYLDLDDCGEVELSPLKNLPALSVVWLNECRIESLEPLAALPSLSVLDITGASYPSLEPLTRSTVTYLEMNRGTVVFDGFDYTPLAQIPGLVYLDISGHSRVDTALVQKILDNSGELQYLNIQNTSADAAALDTSQLTVFAS